MDKNDAYLFRRYITEKEYNSEELTLAEEEIFYLEEEKLLLIKQRNNEIASRILAEDLVKEIQRINNEKDDTWKQVVEDTKKESTKKGLLKGTVVGVVITTILCLLVK